jgi:hypothetical protein
MIPHFSSCCPSSSPPSPQGKTFLYTKFFAVGLFRLVELTGELYVVLCWSAGAARGSFPLLGLLGINLLLASPAGRSLLIAPASS